MNHGRFWLDFVSVLPFFYLVRRGRVVPRWPRVCRRHAQWEPVSPPLRGSSWHDSGELHASTVLRAELRKRARGHAGGDCGGRHQRLALGGHCVALPPGAHEPPRLHRHHRAAGRHPGASQHGCCHPVPSVTRTAHACGTGAAPFAQPACHRCSHCRAAGRGQQRGAQAPGRQPHRLLAHGLPGRGRHHQPRGLPAGAGGRVQRAGKQARACASALRTRATRASR